MVIGKRPRPSDANPGVAEFGKKVLWPGNSTEGKTCILRFRSNDAAAHSPYVLARALWNTFRRCAVHPNDCSCSRQRRKRLAQSPRRQQRVMQIALGDQHDIEIPRQPPMLEAILYTHT